MIHTDVTLKEDGIYSIKTLQTGEVEEKKVANYINIINQEINLGSREYLVTLEYQPVNATQKSTLQVKLSDISSAQAILKLSAYGVDVTDMNKTDIVKHLRNCRDQAEYSYVHHSLGFSQSSDQGENHFYHQKIIGFEHPSQYRGAFNIEPKGSKEVYMKMIQEEVIGCIPLEFGLVLGASSAVIGLLGREYSIENLFFHLVGDSSTGKSTVAMLAISLWGSPTLVSNGLISSWNTTFNALQKKLAGNYGVAVCLDEASQYIGKNITNVIYSLAEGTTRSRLNKEIELQSGDNWRTTILSTGECSLMDQAHQNTGLRVRLFELNLDQWTRSAENSNQIKRVIQNHYGFLGLQFVEYLLSYDLEEIKAEFEAWEEGFIEALPDTPLKSRLASKLAILMLTCELLEKMGIDVHCDEISELIMEQFGDIGVEEDLGVRAYHKFLNYISTNRHKFYSSFLSNAEQNQHHSTQVSCQGRIKYKLNQEIEEIAIITSEFKKIMVELGFQSPQLVLKAWKAKGWLIVEDNKLQKRVHINRVRTNCNILNVQKAEQELNREGRTTDGN